MTTDRDNPRTPALRWAVRPLIAAALMTGLVLRLAFGLGYWIEKPLTLDEQEYLLLAQSLVEGRGLTYPSPSVQPGGARHFERPPGYPVFLAGVMTLSGGFAGVRGDRGVPTPVKVVQSIVGMGTILLIGLIARRAAGQKAGAIAVWIAAIYPPLVWSCAYVLAETLYMALAFAVVLLLGDAFDEGRSNGWKVCAAGVVVGAALLTREAMLFFLVVGALWLVACRRWSLVAVFLAGVLVIMLPWTLRNAFVHGGFVVGSPHGGVTFWTGNNELARGEGDMAANPVLRRISREIEAQNTGLSARELDGLYYRKALEFITSHPLSWVWIEVRKVFYTVVPIGPSYRLHSPLYFGASVVSYLGVLPFAVAGFLRLVRRERPPLALLLMALSAVFLSLALFPQERFRIPVIDPALIICAASWWALRSAPAAVPAAKLRA
jgi:4-amino-4-deoxy-L-arabinose transferase-like glycosyltransferase